MDSRTAPMLIEAHLQARTGSLALRRPAPGVLIAAGATRLDLVQRLSTNELTEMAEGEVRPTVLTTAIGRIVDRLHVLSLGDRLALITSPGRAETVLAWLRGHVFFQDEVTLSPAFPAADHWFLLGPQAADQAAHAVEGSSEGRGLLLPGALVWPATPPEPIGVHLLLQSEAAAAFATGLAGVVDSELGEAVYQGLRVEAGYPEFGQEFDDGDIPLEVGLTHAVSFRKGCYLGQEIIARMESRAKLPRRLVGARLSSFVGPPIDLIRAARSVGRLTSAAFTPRLGWIGLAVVRGEALDDVVTANGGSLQLVELPFPQEAPSSRQV
jgi:tRNA-modifying protein YgfZ